MMQNPLTWLFALGLWILGGWWFGSTICCGGAATSSLMIKDGATTIASTNAGNLVFGVSDAKPEMGAAVKTEFGDLAAHLKENSDKALTLNGHYLKSEANNSTFANLGLARAEALKTYLIGLGVPAAQLLTGSVLKTDLEVNDNQVYGGMDYTFGEMAGGRSIRIYDGTALEAGTEDNLFFSMSSYDYNSPLSTELTATFKQTADYLKANPKRSITITGLYTDQEKNNSILPNLGFARADKIKSMLMEMGVSAKQILTDGRMDNDLMVEGENIIGGAVYGFEESSGDRLAEVEKRLRAQPLVLYFQTNSDQLTLSAQQRQYLADLTYYLDNKDGGQAISTGHTDNRGAASLNQRLSRKRAEFVKNYLVKNGNIKAGLISASGKGPDAPIADNTTNEGRAKNRRVEISIK